MSKKDRLMEIIEELQELYPKLEVLMVSDLEDPDSITITSRARALEVAEEYGLDASDLGLDFEEEDEDFFSQYSKKIGYDEGDDGNGGMLQ